MRTKDFRVSVMSYAHELFTTTGQAWSICLLKAWELYRLAMRMRRGTVHFVFQKVDGSIRHANGTLMFAYRPSASSAERKPCYKTFRFFDTDKHEFRSFKVANLVTVY